MGLGIHSTDRIVPELQSLAVGDIIKTDPGGGMTVVAIEPGQALVLRAKIDALTGRHLELDAPVQGMCFDTSWAFVLNAAGKATTRLVTRFRADYVPTVGNELMARLALEPAVFIMERKMLMGIRQRANRWAAATAAPQTK